MNPTDKAALSLAVVWVLLWVAGLVLAIIKKRL